MTAVPPVNWQDAATEGDALVLSSELGAELRAVIAAAIDRRTRWMVMFVAGWGTLVVGSARLLW